ncbi:MAG: iron-sulfur cluster assembly scaffold protein [Alphaproteobacteria bacterium]
MLNEIYNRKILSFAADIPLVGKLDAPQGRATVVSRLCGSKVSVELSLAGGRVSEFAHDVKACALGQASSSIMARNIIGATPEELRAVGAQMRAMLMEHGPAPTGTWSDLQVLEPVRDFKSRHASTLLTFDAVEKALDMALADAASEAGEPVQPTAANP